MMCYERSCRLCLTDLTEAPVDCSTIPELYETVTVLFEVQINRTDNIRCICNSCLDYVMGYRALKKKITECQKIIQDYENVRKKVMENRNIIRAVKQEVIDVDTFESTNSVETQTSGKNQALKRPRPAVTDSEIDDILAIVHDKSSSSRTLHSSSRRRLTSNAPDIMRPIKTERLSPSPIEIEQRSPSIEPISSTSRDLTEKPSEGNECIGSSSLGESSENFPLPAANEEKPATRSSTTDPNEAVTSSVQTPSESVHKRITERTSRRRQTFSKSPPKENMTRSRSTPRTGTAWHNCFVCPQKFKSKEDLNVHSSKKHRNRSKTVEKQSTSLNTPKIKEEVSISSSSRNTSIRRSERQAKSQALKKISPKPETSPSPVRKMSRVDKPNDTPNNSLATPQQTSTPVPAAVAANNSIDKSTLPLNNSIKSEHSSGNFGNSSFLKDSSLNKSDKKRIITITLVRTKDSLNFRYCDQYKRHIDFNTVSPDELEDIRKSLMIPEIWANLREAFKNSPPDEKTIEQLKAILGDEYIL